MRYAVPAVLAESQKPQEAGMRQEMRSGVVSRSEKTKSPVHRRESCLSLYDLTPLPKSWTLATCVQIANHLSEE